MLPNRLLARSYLLRGTRLWLMSRAMIAFVFLMAGNDPVRLPTLVSVAFVVLTVAICFLDTYRHREGALLGNMGTGPLLLTMMFVSPALAGEFALRVIAAMLQ